MVHLWAYLCVPLVGGLDEASSLAHTFETLGQRLFESGNRVVMASRSEGISYRKYYENSRECLLVGLPELNIDQQYTIASHQIKGLAAPILLSVFLVICKSQNVQKHSVILW